MPEVIKYIVEQFAEHKESVEFRVEKKEQRTEITVVLEPSDMGKVIGKQGKIAKAMRALLSADAFRGGERYSLEIREKGEV